MTYGDFASGRVLLRDGRLQNCRSAEKGRDNARSGCQHLVDLCRVFAAGLGEIWTAAAPTADNGREFLDDPSRLQLAGEILRDGDNQSDLAIVFSGKYNH